MLHARTDYDPIQDPRENGIGEDEPVMLFRAKDALAPEVLDAYARLIRARTNDPELALQVERHAERMREWQAANGKKFPDVYPHHYLQDSEPEPEGPVTDQGYEQVPRPPASSPDAPVEPVGIIGSPQGGYTAQVVQGETISFNPDRTGQLAHTPVYPGSLVMVQGGENYIDDGENAVRDGNGQQVGTIDYESGQMQMMQGGSFASSYEYDAQPAEPESDVVVPPDQPPEQIGILTQDIPEDQLTVNEGSDTVDTPKDEMEVTQHPAEEVEQGTSEPDYTPPGEETEPSEDAEGPLSEGGAALMGGQPTEHTPGVPDAPTEAPGDELERSD